MIASGFTAAPVSQCLFFGVIASSILVSITDTKYLFYIQVVPHLWQYRQAWRLLIWQVCLAPLKNLPIIFFHEEVASEGEQTTANFCERVELL